MSSGNGLSFSYGISGLSDGSYTFSVYAQDLAGNKNETEKVVFAINTSVPGNQSDTNPPTVTISEPSPFEGQVVTTSSIIASAFVSDDVSVNTCILNFDGVNYSMSIAGSGSSATCTAVVSGLANGNHSFYVYANDSSGNYALSQVRSFSVSISGTQDTTPPVITIVNPTNITYTSVGIPVNVTLNEQGTCTYSLNSGNSNSTLTNNANLSFTGNINGIGNGTYTFTAYCLDLSGNSNKSSVSFILQTPSGSTTGGTSGGSSGGSSGGGSGGRTRILNFTSPDEGRIVLNVPQEEESDSKITGSAINSTGKKSALSILIIIFLIGIICVMFLLIHILLNPPSDR